MGTPNMNTGNLKDLEKRIKRLERANPLSASSLGRGRMRFYDGSELLIQNGALNVTGSATISGVLDVTGTFNASGDNNLSGTNSLTGPTTISGSLDVTGPTNLDGVLTINGDTTITGQLDVTGPTNLDGILTINGDTTITGLLDITGDTTVTGTLDVTGPMSTKGTLSVEGVTTLKNDLNVTEGGKIKAGNLEIEPANGGQINFTGGSLSAGSFGALLNNLTAVELQAPTVRLLASNVNIPSLPTKPASDLTPLGIDAAGGLHRIS